MARDPITLLYPAKLAVELAPAYWRLLVARVPQIAADRLVRDIRSQQFGHGRLLERINDLTGHARARVRDRAHSELLPALAMTGEASEEAPRP